MFILMSIVHEVINIATSLIRLLSLFEYMLEDSGSAETKKYYYFHMTSFHWLPY